MALHYIIFKPLFPFEPNLPSQVERVVLVSEIPGESSASSPPEQLDQGNLASRMNKVAIVPLMASLNTFSVTA